eukprot:21957-Pyramimonas_sp.AAC.1
MLQTCSFGGTPCNTQLLARTDPFHHRAEPHIGDSGLVETTPGPVLRAVRRSRGQHRAGADQSSEAIGYILRTGTS